MDDVIHFVLLAASPWLFHGVSESLGTSLCLPVADLETSAKSGRAKEEANMQLGAAGTAVRGYTVQPTGDMCAGAWRWALSQAEGWRACPNS